MADKDIDTVAIVRSDGTKISTWKKNVCRSETALNLYQRKYDDSAQESITEEIECQVDIARKIRQG